MKLTSLRLRRLAAMGLIFGMACVSGYAGAADAALEVMNGSQLRTFTRAELLRLPGLHNIEIANDASYHKTMRYQAVPVAALLPQVQKMISVQFTAMDGFVANIPGPLLASNAQAWLAIEPADGKWPPLKSGSAASAGPFYLVWLTPEKAGISNEQWPYQIARIAESQPLEMRHPQVLPKTAADSAELRGLKVYVTNCAVCHRINGGGDAAIGPDLNKPYNPTEYFQEAYLRKLIRDPASVRSWKQSAMPGFSEPVLPETDLNDLLAYLRQMAKQR
ncbi:cytochrome c [Undibacterium sp.]|jgi:mono/diheme cytochrome c family protein|uniref:c-type cytochrome n=1 Tax=Undibacterium sp. TaxID=1914977 RepID=UPI002C3D9D44|nr:cytochrome c [Undibacterium sp.]HTD04961.1 cytochrome c [Undibacterium sp.]